MRVMYDAVTPTNVPTTAVMVAGYVDGNYQSYAGLAARFPNAVHISIAVQADTDADVLDCETYDATPDQCPAWAQRQRARGKTPCVYMNESTWPAVQQAFVDQKVAAPLWWVARYDGDPTPPPGAFAKQYIGNVGYDESSVSDYWPGVDPDPIEDDMTPAESAQLDALYKALIPRVAALDTVAFNIDGGSGQPSIRTVLGSIAAKVGSLTPSGTVDVNALAASLASDLGPTLSTQLVTALGAAITKGA